MRLRYLVLQIAMAVLLAGSVMGQPVGGGSSSSTTVNSSNIVYVAKSGNNSTGARNSVGRPFLTIAAAKVVALAGDVIHVMPGTYTENNLLKAGVNYFGESGAHILYSQTVSNDAGYAIFDDRPTGATTNIIIWNGNLTMLGETNMAFSSLDANFAPAPNTLGGVMTITNSATHIEANLKECAFGSAMTGERAVLYIGNGYQNRIKVTKVYDPYEGYAWQDSEFFDFSSSTTGLYWEAGDLFFDYDHIRATRYAIYYFEPGNTGHTNDIYCVGKLTEGRIYGVSYSSTYRGWFKGEEFKPGPATSAGPFSFYGSGKWYVDALKIDGGTSGDCINTSAQVLVTNVQVWVTAQKMSAAGNGSWVNLPVGTAFIQCQHFEDTNSLLNGFVTSSNTTLTVIGGKAALSGVGLKHQGGNTTLDGVTITSTNHAAISVSGTGLKIKNCVLVSATNAIAASAAYTVSALWSAGNKTNSSNITLSPVSGWTVDANIQ